MTTGAGTSSEEQGAIFEDNFRELVGRLLERRLGYPLLENRLQQRGSQYGKDIQTRWIDGASGEIFWQFECKSHKTGSLKAKEVADKLFDLMRSSHEVDVWCLTLAHVEPSQWIDETFAWARTDLDLPFELEVLSPSQNNIKQLFALEPDLFRRQYPDETAPDISRREAVVIESFQRFLRDGTARARSRRSTSGAAWQVVDPERMPLHHGSSSRAAAYLRGLTATAPWEVASSDWAVRREASTGPLLQRILHGAPGFDFVWLVAAGGEGKSTVMKQVAWSVAKASPGWTVLWTEAESRQTRAAIPVALIEELSDGSNVLLCVDGSDGLAGAERLRAAADRLADSRKRVFALFADRGVTWNRSRLPGKLRRGLPDLERRIGLAPLSENEARDLVEILERRSLLRATSADEAFHVLVNDERRWLLPTLMQLTDPEGRGFEGILASVLSALKEESSTGPLLLLLAASMAQAGGHALPEDMASRLVERVGELASTMEVLTAELERKFGVARDALGLGARPGTMVTHHRVVADGFVTVAAGAAEFAERLLRACDALPVTVAPDITDADLIPRPQFRVLDAALRSLLDRDSPVYEAADRFLRSLISLDRRQFPALDRLGVSRPVEKWTTCAG